MLFGEEQVVACLCFEEEFCLVGNEVDFSVEEDVGEIDFLFVFDPFDEVDIDLSCILSHLTH